MPTIIDFPVTVPVTAAPPCAATHRVTYRASVAGRADAEICLWIAAEAATVADAWARLSALCPDVDPMSLEIEIREIAPA